MTPQPEDSLLELDDGPRKQYDETDEGSHVRMIELGDHPAPITGKRRGDIERSIASTLGGGINARAERGAEEQPKTQSFHGGPALFDALGDIAAEASRNANESSDIASERNRIVGFNSPEGYARAAALAVDAQTRAQYIAHARSGGIVVDESTLPPLPDQSLPVGKGIVHEPTGPSVFDRPASERAFKVGQPMQTVADDTVGIALKHGELVAGAAAEGHGIIVGWSGKGDMLRSQLVAISDQVGLPREWLPAPASLDVQLTRAIKHVAAERHLEPKQEKAKDRQVVEARKVDSRWMLASRVAEGARVGKKFGEIVLVATLYGESLEFDDDGDPNLNEQVRTKYDELVNAQRYIAADVTKWIIELIRFRFEGIKYGGNYYVPRKHRAAVERLVEAFIGPNAGAPAWGVDWMNPPLPIASGKQLAAGLRNALVLEVERIVDDIAKAREEAAERKHDEISETKRGTFEIELRRLMRKAVAYAELLGETEMATCQAKLHATMVDLHKVEGGFARERFDLIMDELRRDAIRNGEVLS